MKNDPESFERPREVERIDPVVPLVDLQRAGRIYHPSIHQWALVGALIGALALGSLGYALAAGSLAFAGFGQWAVGGAPVGATTGGGLGAALGGLAGALIALYRMPARKADH